MDGGVSTVWMDGLNAFQSGCGMAGCCEVFDNQELLEHILLQLDGEMRNLLAVCAAGGGLEKVGAAHKTGAAKTAHKATLASRLVCHQWRARAACAIASTRVRLRMLGYQTLSAFKHCFLRQHHFERQQGLLDVSPVSVSSPAEFLTAGYEHGAPRMAGCGPDAALDVVRHLQEQGIVGRFLIAVPRKKIHAWELRINQTHHWQSQLVTCHCEADLKQLSNRLAHSQILLVPYDIFKAWPKKRLVKYVILDEARSFMWRPELCALFNIAAAATEADVVKAKDMPTESLLLDDFRTRPRALGELFQLVHAGYDMPTDLQDDDDAYSSGTLGLHAHVMKALDPFNFSESKIYRLLRPQLEAALGHFLCPF